MLSLSPITLSVHSASCGLHLGLPWASWRKTMIILITYMYNALIDALSAYRIPNNLQTLFFSPLCSVCHPSLDQSILLPVAFIWGCPRPAGEKLQSALLCHPSLGQSILAPSSRAALDQLEKENLLCQVKVPREVDSTVFALFRN